MNYDDVEVTAEDTHFLVTLNGKTIVANSVREVTLAVDYILDLPDNCEGKTVDITTAKRRASKNRRKEEIAGRVIEPLTTDDFRLHHCRFQELKIEPKSVQLILTDLPYCKAFLRQVPDLAEFAGSVLVDGGLFVVAVGKAYLPHYFAEFGKRLEWGWQATTAWKNSHVHHPRNCLSRYCPWLVYSKGNWIKRRRWMDRFDSLGKEKQLYRDQKPVSDVEHWLRCFSEVGDLVCDPCSGSFTTAEACFRNNRRFVGCDRLESIVIKGQQRMAEIFGEVERKHDELHIRRN